VTSSHRSYLRDTLLVGSSVQPVSERHQRANVNMQQTDAVIRTTIDAIPVQIWSGPADGSVDFCNERWRTYTGLSQAELRGDGWQRVLHPEDRDRVLNAWYHSVATGTCYEQEERHQA